MTRRENSRRDGFFRIAVRSRWSSRTGYIQRGEFARTDHPRMRTEREPHIGEYAGKTNAIRDLAQKKSVRRPRPIRTETTARCGLLVVVLQDLIAGLGDLLPVLLQAGQDREVALIDHGAAEALDIARTGRLFLRGTAALILGYRTAGNRNREQ